MPQRIGLVACRSGTVGGGRIPLIYSSTPIDGVIGRPNPDRCHSLTVGAGWAVQHSLRRAAQAGRRDHGWRFPARSPTCCWRGSQPPWLSHCPDGPDLDGWLCLWLGWLRWVRNQCFGYPVSLAWADGWCPSGDGWVDMLDWIGLDWVNGYGMHGREEWKWIGCTGPASVCTGLDGMNEREGLTIARNGSPEGRKNAIGLAGMVVGVMVAMNIITTMPVQRSSSRPPLFPSPSLPLAHSYSPSLSLPRFLSLPHSLSHALALFSLILQYMDRDVHLPGVGLQPNLFIIYARLHCRQKLLALM